MIKYLLTLLFLSISSLLIAQPAPDRDSNKEAKDINGNSTFTDEGIWHKNMELICPVPVATTKSVIVVE